MKRYLIILPILLTLTVCRSVKAQQDTSKLTILEYGFPPGNDYLNARATVSNKWSIQFNSVADCIVPDQLIDSVKNHNEKTYSKIIDKYGKNWETHFGKEVERELLVQKKARKLIDNEPYIAKLDSTLGTEGNGLHYYLTPQYRATYSAIVFGWGDWNGKTELVTYYKLTIEINKGIVRVDSDKIELFEFQ
ncbi:MAG: hypothetical protein R3C61_20865 [Bacteroidia bacterium]